MDKKKLLLVAASVGMFLVIVLGASILVFTPGERGGEKDFAFPPRNGAAMENGAASQTGMNTAAVAGNAAIPPGYIPAAGTGMPAAGAGMPGGIPQTAGTAGLAGMPAAGAGMPAAGMGMPAGVPAGAAPPSPAGVMPGMPGAYPPEYYNYPGAQAVTPHERNVISIPTPENAGLPPNSTGQTAQPPVNVTRTNVSAQYKQTAEPVKTTPAASKPARAPSGKANYWVQTGSYAQKSYADNTKTYLSTKGIDSIVLSTIVNGKTYYRVRVGPYVSQNEAGYWLSLIKSIEGMENSQVWKSGT